MLCSLNTFSRPELRAWAGLWLGIGLELELGLVLRWELELK